MDITLLGVVLLVAGAVSVAFIAWVISWYRQRKLIQRAGQWLPVEAKIESGALVLLKGCAKVAKSFCRHLHSLIRFPNRIILGAFPSGQIFPRYLLSQ
jgi:hypothetical protein